MAHVCDANCENCARLDEAVARLEISTGLLMKTVLSDSDEAVELAWSKLRLAKVRFFSARALCRENCQPCEV